MQSFLIFLDAFAFAFVFLSRRCSAADYRYEACGPRKCGNGPNISFPFYIQGQQESYCGYPGFGLNCSRDGNPVLQLSESEYVVDDIFYETRTFRVYNSAVLGLNSSNCLLGIRNSNLPIRHEVEFADNVTNLHLFSDCNNSLARNLSLDCNGSRVLALYDKDENFENASENCTVDLVEPVEDDGNLGMENLTHVLRRGFVMTWRASDCSDCRHSGGHCGFNESRFFFQCFCPDSPHSSSCRPYRENRSLALILGSVFGAVLAVASLSILLILIGRKMINNEPNSKNIVLFLKQHENLAPRRYKYSELKKMTKSFNDSLGEGGYGSVYKAKSKDGRLLAVKILKESKNGEEFINEVASISRTSHVNVVALLGFCFEGSKRALVYEFMPNGSLDKFLESQLGWDKLFDIAVGIARGLDYLHKGCQMQILHFDIKPHNILLDKDFQPKISDFGLAKLCPNRASITVMSGTRGTAGYIAPEMFCRNFGKVSHKSDVYSYGMMVLDIVGEKQNTDPARQQTSETYFPHWIYEHLEMDGDWSVDDDVEEEGWRMMKRKLTIVGLWCIQTDPKERPSMSEVVDMLEGNVESLQIPPKPYLSSPPRPSAAANASFLESSISED